MRRSRPLLLGGLAVLLAVPPASGKLRDILVARQIMADVAPTCVVRVAFDPAKGDRETLYALAFSLEGVFWIYSPETGTQVLGPASRLWPDPVTLSARLRELDPTVAAVTVHSNPVSENFRQDQLYLVNACVIGSLHSLLWVLHDHGSVDEAGLILMSYDTPDAATAPTLRVNHSLLAYRQGRQWWCIDPLKQRETFRLKEVKVGAPLDPALVALTLKQRYPVKSVSLLKLSDRTLDRITSNVQWQLPGFSD
ncbi:MAG: hypothetical protein JSR48_04495 [Verrucomicrobia bacterium]|nr:hypothetical protein [Verrucomicrobiota bacterium]